MVITLAPITNVKPISGINVHKHSSLTNILAALIYPAIILVRNRGSVFFCIPFISRLSAPGASHGGFNLSANVQL